MTFPEENITFFHLTFCELLILAVTIRGKKNHSELIAQLDSLLDYTSDSQLLEELSSLKEKVLHLSEEQFTVVQMDAITGRLLEPPGYVIE